MPGVILFRKKFIYLELFRNVAVLCSYRQYEKIFLPQIIDLNLILLMEGETSLLVRLLYYLVSGYWGPQRTTF